LRVETRTPAFAGLAAERSAFALGEDQSALERLRRWLEADGSVGGTDHRIRLSVALGIPGIEICRAAEQLPADLIVVGRKQHSQRARLLLGDTADAVARRSRFPCLFVPAGAADLRNLLVALDGSDRGMVVLEAASDFARIVGGELKVITVERNSLDEPSPSIPSTRSSALQARVSAAFRHDGLPALAVTIRRGPIAEAVLTEIQESTADILVLGYHRGGPPGVIEAGSTARRLAHAAPCSVLTVPL
jgi:nucleotide-binding universal stress UspA family protein